MLHYVRATLLTPTGPPDWVDMPLTAHIYEAHKALAEVNGKPAIVYATEPAATIYQVRYAYGNIPEPNDATDWTSTAATGESVACEHFSPGQLLIDDPYPPFSYYSSETDQLYYPQATVDPPATPADWVFTPATEPAHSGNYSALAWWQDKTVLLHAGPTSDQMHCSRSLVGQPSTLLDWESHAADNESLDLKRLSVIQLPDGIGVTYRNGDPPGTVMYAWFEESMPDGPWGWCVVEVAGNVGPDGGQALALTADGRPAIAYKSMANDFVWLATMDPPE